MKKICTGVTWFLVIMVCFSCASCISSKTVTYFNNLPDSARIQLDSLTPPQQYIQVNDVLDIRVGGENEKTVQYLNQYVNNSSLYTVDLKGEIELPKVGALKVSGLTKEELKALIQRAYTEYLINPVITVNVTGFKFAVLGAVRGPGLYTSTNEKINLFEAIAQAGDMQQFAKRDNVHIIRDINGKREIITLDFNNSNILNSPYYYINKYDIIYVESQKAPLFSENYSRIVPIFGTLTGVLALILTLFK